LKSQLNSLIAGGTSPGKFGSPAVACTATAADAATTKLPKQSRIPQRPTATTVRSPEVATKTEVQEPLITTSKAVSSSHSIYGRIIVIPLLALLASLLHTPRRGLAEL
jgi:hypothetical protein